MLPPDDLITIGKIKGNWGRKGLVKVLPLTNFPERLPHKREVWLWREDTGTRLYRITEGFCRGEYVYLGLDGVEDIGAAKDLKGSLVMVHEEGLEELPEGAYYRHQIIGLEVVREDGQVLGSVDDIIFTGASDIYVIRKGDREMMLPAVKEFIVRIDLGAGRMIVRPPEGLEELP